MQWEEEISSNLNNLKEGSGSSAVNNYFRNQIYFKLGEAFDDFEIQLVKIFENSIAVHVINNIIIP